MSLDRYQDASEGDQRLLAAIDAAEETAYGSDGDSELSDSRAAAIYRYLGRNIDPAPEGRSQVRDRTTYEVVEWTKPSLLRIFCGTDEVVKFEPVGPEDEQQAEQESQFINYVVTQRNPWLQICHDWFTDALVLKNGYALAYSAKVKHTELETYESLSDDAAALLLNDEEVEVVEASKEPDTKTDELNQASFAQASQQYAMAAQQAQMQAMQSGQPPQLPPPPQPPPPAFLHTIKIRRTRERPKICIEALDPARCKVDANTASASIDDSTGYFEWYDFCTIGSLRAAGLDVPDDISDDNRTIGDRFDAPEEQARNLYSEDSLTWRDSRRADDPSMRLVRCRYIWIRHDANGDGIPELLYVIRIGSTVLHQEECAEIPVASISPIPMPHRHIGMSVADTVSDIEDVNTAFTRQAIDNLFYSNNPRLAVSDNVNMGDLLDSRPGGIIRVDGQPPQEIMPVVVPDMFPQAVQALQFFDSRRMNRTGINAYFQGTDANVLNKTASGISQLTSSAAQRVELIARLFSFGIARLFGIVHRLILQSGHKSEVVRLRGNWTTVNPSEWRRRTDLRVVVGLGTGSKEGQMANLGGIFQAQMAVLPMGVAKPDNIYNTLTEMAKAASLGNPHAFFTDPSTSPPPQPPPDPTVEAAKIKGQVDMQTEQAKLGAEQQKTALEMQFEQWKFQQEMEFEKWKVQFEAQVDLEKEAIKARVQAETTAATIGSQERVKGAELSVKADENEMKRATAESSKAAANDLGELKQSVKEMSERAESRKVVGLERVRGPDGKLKGAKIKRADGSTEDISLQ